MTTLNFSYRFDQKIEPNSLPESLITPIFGYYFNQKIEHNTLSESLITPIFGYYFNQKIEPNTLPDSLIKFYFGWIFNQKIDPNSLPSNLKYIEFNWKYLPVNIDMSSYIEMVNNIPSYYDVKIFLKTNILDNYGLKWPIHVRNYIKNRWPVESYEVIDKYKHPIYGNIIVLINKKTYQPYSSAKSTLK